MCRPRGEERRQVEDARRRADRGGRDAPRRRGGRRRTTRAACRARSRSASRPSRAGPPTRAAFARCPERAKRSGIDLVHDAVRVPGRTVVADGGDEVVGVRDVVPDEPFAGHPAVADRRRRTRSQRYEVTGFSTRKDARHHVSCSLSSSTSARRNMRLAVPHVAHGNRVDAAPRGTRRRTVVVVPELGRGLEDVERRTRRGAAAASVLAHPLTAPWVSPPTIQRCRTMKMRTTGRAASTTPAQNGPHSCPNWSETKPYRPTESVYLSGACSSCEAMMYSFSVDDEREQPDHGEHGRAEREDDPPEDLGRGRAVDARRLVELGRDRVEEAHQEPRVDAERAAEVDEDQAGARVEADRRGRRRRCAA